MAITISRGDSDPVIEEIIDKLRAYEADHSRSEIAIYRHNPVSVRIRIIDPDFAAQNRIERSNRAWKYLDGLSDDVQSYISSLILLTPDETKMSFANLEFDDPVPSIL